MTALRPTTSLPEYTVDHRAPHALHECRNAEEFRSQFAATTGCPVEDIANEVIAVSVPKALFLVGSMPLGMATSGSDVDVIALVDRREDLVGQQSPLVNNSQQLEFLNGGDSLLAGMFLMLKAGILVDLQVAIAPEIQRVQRRLRLRGPDLTENEVRTLGRLGTGWLLWQTEGYIERSLVTLGDRALDVYCCTKHFVSALVHQRKALKALQLEDTVLALHLGRSSVELAYLAYFASEGISYLGAKWPAQIGHARGAAERVARRPILKDSAQLLFPAYPCAQPTVAHYLEESAEFLTAMQALIEEKVLFRIAFNACPQIDSK